VPVHDVIVYCYCDSASTTTSPTSFLPSAIPINMPLLPTATSFHAKAASAYPMEYVAVVVKSTVSSNRKMW